MPRFRPVRMRKDGGGRGDSHRNGEVAFSRDLALDADGIVVQYPWLFRRTWP